MLLIVLLLHSSHEGVVHAGAAMSGLVWLLKVIPPAKEGHSRPRAAIVMLPNNLFVI